MKREMERERELKNSVTKGNRREEKAKSI